LPTGYYSQPDIFNGLALTDVGKPFTIFRGGPPASRRCEVTEPNTA